MSVDSFSVNPFVGFGCAGYRSFSGAEPARIGPFDKVQVIPVRIIVGNPHSLITSSRLLGRLAGAAIFHEKTTR